MDEDTEQPPEAIGIDYEAQNQQSLTQVIEPYTQTSISTSTQPLNRKAISSHEGEGETALDAPNKDDLIESDPTALPLEKKRRVEPEVSVNPSVSSQQDIELQTAHKQSLASSSQ